MRKNLHPGHKILRELFPDPKQRRTLVAELCEQQSHTDEPLTVEVVHRALVSNGAYRTERSERELVTAFINSI